MSEILDIANEFITKEMERISRLSNFYQKCTTLMQALRQSTIENKSNENLQIQLDNYLKPYETMYKYIGSNSEAYFKEIGLDIPQLNDSVIMIAKKLINIISVNSFFTIFYASIDAYNKYAEFVQFLNNLYKNKEITKLLSKADQLTPTKLENLISAVRFNFNYEMQGDSFLKAIKKSSKEANLNLTEHDNSLFEILDTEKNHQAKDYEFLLKVILLIRNIGKNTSHYLNEYDKFITQIVKEEESDDKKDDVNTYLRMKKIFQAKISELEGRVNKARNKFIKLTKQDPDLLNEYPANSELFKAYKELITKLKSAKDGFNVIKLKADKLKLEKSKILLKATEELDKLKEDAKQIYTSLYGIAFTEQNIFDRVHEKPITEIATTPIKSPITNDGVKKKRANSLSKLKTFSSKLAKKLKTVIKGDNFSIQGDAIEVSSPREPSSSSNNLSINIINETMNKTPAENRNSATTKNDKTLEENPVSLRGRLNSYIAATHSPTNSIKTINSEDLKIIPANIVSERISSFEELLNMLDKDLDAFERKIDKLIQSENNHAKGDSPPISNSSNRPLLKRAHSYSSPKKNTINSANSSPSGSPIISKKESEIKYKKKPLPPIPVAVSNNNNDIPSNISSIEGVISPHPK